MELTLAEHVGIATVRAGGGKTAAREIMAHIASGATCVSDGDSSMSWRPVEGALFIMHVFGIGKWTAARVEFYRNIKTFI